MKAEWNTTDRILYGVMAGGIALWAIGTFIEACRSRPKIQMMVFGVKPSGKDNGDVVKESNLETPLDKITQQE